MSSLTGLPDDAAWHRLQASVDRIPHPPNRETALRYLRERRAHGVGFSTLAIDANALRHYGQHLGATAFEDATRDDLVAYANAATSTREWRNVRKGGADTLTRRTVPLSQSTMNKRKRILRAFYRWLRGTDEDPPEVKPLKRSRRRRPRLRPEDLLTREEVERLLTAHPDPRDKAIVAVLYEAGLRAQELCSLDVGSVAVDGPVVDLRIPEGAPGLKTGARTPFLIDGGDYVLEWLEAHPRKDDPAAPLFFSVSRRAPGARMTGNALWQWAKRAARKAGITKRVYPHLFRHTSATEKARLGWTEAELRHYYGWSPDSDMPSTYVHLAGRDFKEMALERLGKKKADPTATRGLAPRKCGHCGEENKPNALYCHACRSPVSPKAREEAERRRQEQLRRTAAELVAEVMQERVAAEVARALAAQEGAGA